MDKKRKCKLKIKSDVYKKQGNFFMNCTEERNYEVEKIVIFSIFLRLSEKMKKKKRNNYNSFNLPLAFLF